jgi:hypothetical protein
MSLRPRETLTDPGTQNKSGRSFPVIDFHAHVVDLGLYEKTANYNGS